MKAAPSSPRIVADAAIGWVERAFDPLGELRLVPGGAIDRDTLADADVLLTRSVTRVDAHLLEGTPVRFVGSCTAGIDHVDLDLLRARGIDFAHAPGCNARAVAEYVVTALHAAWRRAPAGTPLGPIAVVGFGAVGRRVTRMLRALGHRVRVCDPPLHDRLDAGLDRCEPGIAGEDLLSLDETLSGARAVTLHVPLEHAGEHPTLHLVEASRLRTLEPGALVVNTSRGGVIDDAALETWARTGRGRAILDVWEGEPALRWSLLEGAPSPVALGTPHVAGYTLDGKARATAMVQHALAGWLGRAPTFEPEHVLGPPGATPLAPDLTPSVADGRDALARCLLAACPLHADDARLRALLRRALPQRTAAFEALRRTYPLRHPIAHFHAPADLLSGLPSDGLPRSLEESLDALGVTTS
jgi:erythronate-4-phosphate dehydrogenase